MAEQPARGCQNPKLVAELDGLPSNELLQGMRLQYFTIHDAHGHSEAVVSDLHRQV